MWNKLKTIHKLWKLSSKDPEYLKAIENLSKEDIQEIPEKGNGKAVFIPLMSEKERDQYLHDQEPVWAKFKKKLSELK